MKIIVPKKKGGGGNTREKRSEAAAAVNGFFTHYLFKCVQLPFYQRTEENLSKQVVQKYQGRTHADEKKRVQMKDAAQLMFERGEVKREGNSF